MTTVGFIIGRRFRQGGNDARSWDANIQDAPDRGNQLSRTAAVLIMAMDPSFLGAPASRRHLCRRTLRAHAGETPALPGAAATGPPYRYGPKWALLPGRASRSFGGY